MPKWVLPNQDSSVAPQTSQDAWPVCGTKNFSAVRLYSAPQLHWTIVAIPGICAPNRTFSSRNLATIKLTHYQSWTYIRDLPHVAEIDVPTILAFGIAAASEFGHGLLKRGSAGRWRLGQHLFRSTVCPSSAPHASPSAVSERARLHAGTAIAHFPFAILWAWPQRRFFGDGRAK